MSCSLNTSPGSLHSQDSFTTEQEPIWHENNGVNWLNRGHTDGMHSSRKTTATSAFPK
ncbi:hypothetical protein XBO1_2410002 [Xenorhabdus bovienii str. oregonense]|uniref:Uncharacterized protein n=1 Tax=Xenorhabdus bovienii str. oregonense TaxID=1398202 RepID=A0A077PAL5_XENBV|nr:hypothetical protein XBO1_2410002 [Xenorhabdus bovienii str. oregonense]